MSIKKLLATGASVAMLLGTSTPAFASIMINVSRNGFQSNPRVILSLTRGGTIIQTNSSDINTSVDSDTDTGDNTANANTGGSVEVDTGNADSLVTVENTGGTNLLDESNECGCPDDDVTIAVEGNGAESTPLVNGTIDEGSDVTQRNTTLIDTLITRSRARTGRNRANRNTGDGESTVVVETGDSTSDVDVSNDGDFNQIGPLGE